MQLYILDKNPIVSASKVPNKQPTHSHFRYAKEYLCNIASKTLLPINECIEQYNAYLNWKLEGVS